MKKSKKPQKLQIKATLKNERYQPENGFLKAEVMEPIEGYGRKIAFNNRYSASVDTGLVVSELPAGHILRFALVERLAEKGMVLTTTAFSGVGPVKVSLVNCGREIVNLLDGETLVQAWLEKTEDYEWSV